MVHIENSRPRYTQRGDECVAFYALNVHSEGDRRTRDKATVFRFFLRTRDGFAFAIGRHRSSVFRQADRRGSFSLPLPLSLHFPSFSSSTGVGEAAHDETKILVDIFLPDARRVDRMIANVRILICSGCNSRPFCRVRPEEYLLPGFLRREGVGSLREPNFWQRESRFDDQRPVAHQYTNKFINKLTSRSFLTIL